MKSDSSGRRSKNYTVELKRSYYEEWLGSEMSKLTFCRIKGISTSAFYKWCHLFKEEAPSLSKFVPVKIKQGSVLIDEIKIEICLANQTRLYLKLARSQLVSFIGELGDASSTLR